MRRLLPAIAGTAALALTLAACGSDGGDTDSDAAPQSDTAPADLEAELTWWDTSDPTNEGPAFDALIEQFNEEYPNVTILRSPLSMMSSMKVVSSTISSGDRHISGWTTMVALDWSAVHIPNAPWLNGHSFRKPVSRSSRFRVTGAEGLLFRTNENGFAPPPS